MKNKELVNALLVQDENLSNLIDALDTQKRAIIEGKYDDLEKAIANEQKILKTVQEEEVRRIKMITEISNSNGMNLNNSSLDELLLKGKEFIGEDYKTIQRIRESIKLKLHDISKLNAQLKAVIELSRNIIKDTLMLVVGPRNQAFVNKRV
ncbi:MAG: flagellar export chaperone FlgN [Melioribacteraceae bacterium]|jgi:hypothetical protein|nr:flagellar export chaperone FlgN [Melioribacteraceae bacterium]